MNRDLIKLLFCLLHADGNKPIFTGVGVAHCQSFSLMQTQETKVLRMVDGFYKYYYTFL